MAYMLSINNRTVAEFNDLKYALSYVMNEILNKPEFSPEFQKLQTLLDLLEQFTEQKLYSQLYKNRVYSETDDYYIYFIIHPRIPENCKFFAKSKDFELFLQHSKNI